jgi:hypothetical protein
MKRLLLSTLCIIVIMAITACADCPLPKVHQWTEPEQIEIAKERRALPPGSILRGALQEWEDTRQALK